MTRRNGFLARAVSAAAIVFATAGTGAALQPCIRVATSESVVDARAGALNGAIGNPDTAISVGNPNDRIGVEVILDLAAARSE